MEFVHEVTAHLENKPGRLAKICAALAHEKINIRALSVMDARERSVLRVVVDQFEPTRKVLTSLGTEHSSTEVLAVEMENRPGALTRILEMPRRASTSTSSTPTSRAHGARQVAGHLPHVQPEARPAGPDRAREQRRRAIAKAVARCTRGEAAAIGDRRLHVVLVEPEIAANTGQHRPDVRGGRGHALARPPARVPPGRPPSPPGGAGLLGTPRLEGRRQPGRGRRGARPQTASGTSAPRPRSPITRPRSSRATPWSSARRVAGCRPG